MFTFMHEESGGVSGPELQTILEYGVNPPSISQTYHLSYFAFEPSINPKKFFSLNETFEAVSKLVYPNIGT